ncbi:MAG: aminodeoxychorismate/anthranilate synthase component II [Thermodesulfovibrio sp.]|uniref:anthranilate synthase component II n=1 Tax=unclassified Thermodesulfovibrio TaxID=2645936 RepID=UPI000839F9BA|nr:MULTISPECIES: aminodeoxychorismate/anthranilate synthase component II [unclassified Thermodesulfovibrio]MDI1470953.1 aminodeoxychorismate/anthranilate synthase component II [Thermodesulfovibrio sp. 1176]MDI6713803.1 aminodeoxychorismate/anthranilate synthase component II [Thermodesulfovibrio sp.]ODA43632.1 Anthranilate synthase, amidotransferase component [Thermodesulfovibrio sp. N1]
MILIIDNYDSFTYNLYQYIGELSKHVIVYRNDQITIEQIEEMKPEKIIISPGPCTPKEAGISCDVIKHFAGKVPILGVCLGHQAIGAAFGAKIIRSHEIMHGKTSLIYHDEKTIFKGISNPFEATRYHSLIIEKESLPECLDVSACTSNGIIMGVRHKEYIIEGVQFHPESILTKVGKDLLKNFLKL